VAFLRIAGSNFTGTARQQHLRGSPKAWTASAFSTADCSGLDGTAAQGWRPLACGSTATAHAVRQRWATALTRGGGRGQDAAARSEPGPAIGGARAHPDQRPKGGGLGWDLAPRPWRADRSRARRAMDGARRYWPVGMAGAGGAALPKLAEAGCRSTFVSAEGGPRGAARATTEAARLPLQGVPLRGGAAALQRGIELAGAIPSGAPSSRALHRRRLGVSVERRARSSGVVESITSSLSPDPGGHFGSESPLGFDSFGGVRGSQCAGVGRV